MTVLSVQSTARLTLVAALTRTAAILSFARTDFSQQAEFEQDCSLNSFTDSES